MKLEEIENAIRWARECRAVSVRLFTSSGRAGAYFDNAPDWVHKRINPWLYDKGKSVKIEVEAKLEELSAEFEAMAKGLILEARQEERPDAHLDEVVRLFGPHKGLNANWAVMAWHLGGLVWLTDDESGKTVTLVTRGQTGEDEVHEIASGLTPAKALQVWAMISEEGR